MSNAMKVAARILCACLLIFGFSGSQSRAQGQPPQAPAASQTTTPPATQNPAPAPAPPPPAPQPPAPPLNFYTGDGTSLTLFYWGPTGHPTLKTGTADTNPEPSNLDLAGKSRPAQGAALSIPIGKSGHNIRISYFRVLGDGDTTATQAITVFGANFNPGDYLATHFNVQNAKVSLDYLSWPYPLKNSRFRLKTLWECQITWINSSIDAPLLAGETDAAGNAVQTTGYGTHWFVYPTLGLGIDYLVSKNFRFEARASGFAFPHRSTIWDTEATLNYRFGHFELQAGGKGFHFKTSPQQQEYLSATLSGVFVGVRWYRKDTTH